MDIHIHIEPIYIVIGIIFFLIGCLVGLNLPDHKTEEPLEKGHTYTEKEEIVDLRACTLCDGTGYDLDVDGARTCPRCKGKKFQNPYNYEK